jgi:hypothetical protein
MLNDISEAASTSETSVNFYQTTRRNIPEGSHLHTRGREKLKFHADIHETGHSGALLKCVDLSYFR